MGFIKLHLKNPAREILALLYGEQAFAMDMKHLLIGDMQSKGKKKKILITRAHNLKVHLKGETLCNNHVSSIYKTFVFKSYYEGKQHEFMGLSKLEFDKDFAFLIMTTEKTRDAILKDILTYNHERL